MGQRQLAGFGVQEGRKMLVKLSLPIFTLQFALCNLQSEVSELQSENWQTGLFARASPPEP
jgi:hypothetical protein